MASPHGYGCIAGRCSGSAGRPWLRSQAISRLVEEGTRPLYPREFPVNARPSAAYRKDCLNKADLGPNEVKDGEMTIKVRFAFLEGVGHGGEGKLSRNGFSWETP